ncbi:Uncharacterized protein Fot_06982 [Forsythia ovata]|uniref:Uncharacterized protein n=1 Tax=Forsythia ovata TaxID=205694 RepID=A0ABD1WUH6_9LAMI
MGNPTFMQANPLNCHPNNLTQSLSTDSHQPPSVHHTFVGLTPPKYDPIDLQNPSTTAILIETISAPANLCRQHASNSIPTLGGRPIASILAGNNPKMNSPHDACYAPPRTPALLTYLMDLFLWPTQPTRWSGMLTQSITHVHLSLRMKRV